MTVVVALAGALAAAAAVYILGYRRGLSPYRLVLVGIGVTTVLQAGTAYMLTLTRFPFATDLAFRWMIGRIYGADWTEVAPAIAAFVVLIALLFLFSRWFAALTLGDGVATGLGAKVEAQRLGLLVVAVGLAAFAVALAGPVGFVAFIAPHIARGLVKRPTGSLPVLAGLVGAVLVVGADLVARRVVAPAELPAGAITALIGAPYFLFLLYRANRLGVGA